MKPLYRVWVVSPEPRDVRRLQSQTDEFELVRAESLDAEPPEDAVFALIDRQSLPPDGALPAWRRRVPIVLCNAPSPDEPTEAAGATAAPLAQVELSFWLGRLPASNRTPSNVDFVSTTLARLSHFSRRLLALDSPGALKQHLPALLGTLLNFDGAALWDWSADELQVFAPSDWGEAARDTLAAQVQSRLGVAAGRREMPPVSVRSALRATAAGDQLRHEAIASVGAAEGLLLVFRVADPAFTPQERRLLDVAASLVEYALRNARLFAGLEAQSRKIIEKNRELLKASRLKTNFIANTSHELKTPLHAIMGLAEILPLADSPAELERMSDRIGANARRLLDIVNDILDYARLVADEARVYARPLALDEFLAEAVNSVSDLAAVKGLRLSWSNASGLATITTDREKLFTILVNLLGNAIKFTPSGEVELRVVAGVDDVQFSVRDTGVGIPPAEQARIFEEFHRAAGPLQETQEGTGLGLAIARELARLLDGRITVQSQLGQGSTFFVTLPVSAHARVLAPALALPHLDERKAP